MSWHAALAGAASRSHLGWAGRLATVTSEAEDAFIRDNVTTLPAWLGGSDDADEGNWRWMAGPEAGQSFWIGGVTQPGFVALWRSGEPDNATWLGLPDIAAHFLVLNHPAAGPYSWSDEPASGTFGHGLGYVVEFGPSRVPLPGALWLTAAALGTLGAAAWRRRRRG